jgi:hypothetical protein
MGTSPASTQIVQALTIGFGLCFRRFWPRMQEYQSSLVDLANRIARLEDALRISHGRYSNEPHPLLDEDRLRIKEPFLSRSRENSDSPEASPISHQASNDGVDANKLILSLDTMSVSGLGRFNYAGPAAWTNVSIFLGRVLFEALCLQTSTAPKGLEFKTHPCMTQLTYYVLQSKYSLTAGHQAVLAALLPPKIRFMAACFTHSLLPGPEEELQDSLATLRCFLPASEEAVKLKVIFYRTCTFAHDPIPEETFDIIFSVVYDTPWNTSGWDMARIHHAHAVMFMLLALASACDTTLPEFVRALVFYSCM